MQLKPVCFFVLFCLLMFCGPSHAQDAGISKKLAGLKVKNDLKEWLYERLDYVNANQQQLPFLLNTQKDAWRQPVNTGEHLAWITLLSTQGYDELLAGDILSSINYYEDAYAYFYKYRVNQFDAVEYIFKPLSNNYTRLGDYERAVFIQQKSLDVLNAFDNADDKASIYSNMAIAYYSMGNYPAAQNCIIKGQELVKSAEVRFRLQNTLADILYDQNQLQQARTLLVKNITSQKKINIDIAYALLGAYTTLGNIDLKSGSLNAAGRDFNNALSLIGKWFPGDRLREKANIIAQLGKIERSKDHLQNALTLFDEALQLLRVNTSQNKTTAQHIYGENNLVDIFHEKAMIYQALKQNELAFENMRYALLATDKIRKEFADNKTKERLQQDGKELAETAIEIALGLYQKSNDKKYLGAILEISEQTKARTLADQVQQSTQRLAADRHDTTMRKSVDLEHAIAYNERLAMTEKDAAKYRQKVSALKYELSLVDKAYRAGTSSSTLPAAEMLTALPGKLHLAAYFFGTRAVYTIDIKNKSVIAVWRIGNADSLRQQLTQFINTYYRNGPDAMLNTPKEFYQQSNSIYKVLFKNLRINDGENLCIVADDVLGYLSFDGLITDAAYKPVVSQWPFLIKKITTSYAFSLNTLVKNKPKANTGNGFMGLFVTHQSNQNTPIIAVKNEAVAIQKLIKGKYLYDDEVNTRSFFNAFENAAVLHISTHAYLTGINKEPTLDFGKEKLFLFELLAKQNKPNLVVLSACRTGDGLLAKGEGIFSLSRGFSAVGTPATIAGLWNVNDDAVSQITASVYKGLLNKQSTGAALHNAKLNWLKNSHASDSMYLPYYWDSLILMGADQSVNLHASGNYKWLYLIVGLVVLLMIVKLLKQKRMPH